MRKYLKKKEKGKICAKHAQICTNMRQKNMRKKCAQKSGPFWVKFGWKWVDLW